jgi:GntR family transcriptional regulator
MKNLFYVRLREVIADAILAGQYGDGDPLPSVRALAAEQVPIR